MPNDSPRLAPALQEALGALVAPNPEVVHRLQVELARLALDQAPPQASAQLQLAERFVAGHAAPDELIEARQDCWTYVGSLACGCSIADSASAHAIMTCLETSEASHTLAALAEQVERVLRCGATEARVLAILKQEPAIA